MDKVDMSLWPVHLQVYFEVSTIQLTQVIWTNIDGENGRGIFLSEKEGRNISAVLNKYKINILASDIIPLNRMVPDSRSPG
jgi:hypothetical protein